MIEVELKARVRDRAAVEAAVRGFASPAEEVDKRDAYWLAPAPAAAPDGATESSGAAASARRDFRVRREGGASVVTFKDKRVELGIEVNVEREFGVSDPAAFDSLALRLGCRRWYEKRKRGLRFEAASAVASGGRATIEVVEIEGLGDFIEIEVLLESAEGEAVAAARSELRALLARAGCAESDIEDRFYSRLLAEAGLAPSR
jgi:predicted adenylyl cyclase CyaB